MGIRSIVSVLVVFVSACSVRVAGGLDEPNANEAIAVLEQRGIAAEKSEESSSGEARFAIEVGRGDFGAAIAALREAGIPRHDDPGIAETYRESSLVPSETEDRARYHAAIAGELARTLERVAGVTDARVHLALPAADPLLADDDAPRAHASVLLTVRGPTPISADEVRALIAGAVDGLSTESVAVVTSPAPAVSRSVPLAKLGPFRVARASLVPLATLLVISLGIHLATAATILAMARSRRKSAQLELDDIIV